MDIPQWIQIVFWLVFIVVTVVAEAITVQFVSIWFSISAAICLILAAFNVDPIVQIVVFAILSVLLFVLSRPLIKKLKTGKQIDATIEGMIGEIVIVTKDIKVGEVGEIKSKYELYSAIAPTETIDLLVGEHVVITETRGNKVVVEKEK